MQEKTLEDYLRRLGNQISLYRQHKGLSQEQLAEETNLDRSFISRIENGKNVGIKNLIKICSALHINTSDLFKNIEGNLTNESK